MAYTKEQILEKQKRWRDKNKEKISESGRAYAERNKEKILLKNKVWKQKNKDKKKKENPETKKATQAAASTGLFDWYVRSVLRVGKDICPPELIELKRDQLTIKRLSRQIKQTTKAHNETSTNIS